MTKANRLYISTFVNSFGTWLTFIALALITKERAGAQFVALVFLIQTLPGIFLSRSLSRLVPVHRQKQVFFLTQILLGLNSLVLVFFQSIPAIIAHLLIAAVLRSLSGPLLNALLGTWVVEGRERVFTRIGAIQTATLALAPMVGAWIKVVSSAEILFLIDTLSFVLGLLFLFGLPAPSTTAPDKRGFHWRDVFGDAIPHSKGLPKSVWSPLLVWFAFLAAGAILNAIEFPGFERLNLSETEIGYALAAWGVGNLIAFLVPLRSNAAWPLYGYALALVLFVFAAQSWHVFAAFALAGTLSAYLAGRLRADIQSCVSEGDSGVHVWAFANQITQLINLVAYAASGAFLGSLGFGFFAGALLVSLCLLLGLGMKRWSQVLL